MKLAIFIPNDSQRVEESQRCLNTNSTALAADVSGEVGVQAPLGFFDPLGIIGDAKDADQEQFDRLRWVELKHGRIAMLA
eukprot:CAMPEP_0168201134 /NCGR_PEP_ID=MMETSP0139_2-20121125/23492_1 /TAXON_ID=44445 /ORGANISM="Pseudo-nitzschia australis, Strain 10249 10 AB" /LENGTH=79 /DNA_ID=CAMNT_0008126565 /DNA_START=178 /DNA_END=413 /DNA_ORIENTATION=-